MSPACAYLVSRYPGVTHTFIVGEVRALRATGVRVHTASVRRVALEEVLSRVDREEHDATHALLPASLGRLVAAHGRALASSPRAYGATLARALRSAPSGGKGVLWQAFYFGEAMLLWAWMKRRGLHHVHVHHANVSADVASLACHFAGGLGARWTWSLTLHGPTELLDVSAHNLPAKVRDAAAVVCISDFARSQIAAFAAPDDLARVRTVHCGIDVTAFRPPPGRSARADGRAEVLCVAALSRRKGHRVLLEALAQLRERGLPVVLTLAGDGPERAPLEAHADALGVGEDVRFVGAVGHDRIAALYERADVFCLPSFAEGVPTVLMEAMATELPVVATNVMGVPELVEHEVSGLLVVAGRSGDLAAAIERLVADPGLRERMGAAGRRRVVADFEMHGAAGRLREVLAPLL